jgi:hypothetical protein
MFDTLQKYILGFCDDSLRTPPFSISSISSRNYIRIILKFVSVDDGMKEEGEITISPVNAHPTKRSIIIFFSAAWKSCFLLYSWKRLTVPRASILGQFTFFRVRNRKKVAGSVSGVRPLAIICGVAYVSKIHPLTLIVFGHNFVFQRAYHSGMEEGSRER